MNEEKKEELTEEGISDVYPLNVVGKSDVLNEEGINDVYPARVVGINEV